MKTAADEHELASVNQLQAHVNLLATHVAVEDQLIGRGALQC
jgi:hypothetical protein